MPNSLSARQAAARDAKLRASSAPVVVSGIDYLDQYPVLTADMSTGALLQEATRLESAPLLNDNDVMRLDFCRRELVNRRVISPSS